MGLTQKPFLYEKHIAPSGLLSKNFKKNKKKVGNPLSVSQNVVPLHSLTKEQGFWSGELTVES